VTKKLQVPSISQASFSANSHDDADAKTFVKHG
jgi:hypothetical protein